jgi:hypothetical protein
MPYIVTTTLYPSDKVDEVVKVFLDSLKKYPPDDTIGTRVVPSAVTRNLQGIKSIAITEVKKGRLEDAVIRTANILSMYNTVQGYEGSFEVYLTIEEALGTIGMSLPA